MPRYSPGMGVRGFPLTSALQHSHCNTLKLVFNRLYDQPRFQGLSSLPPLSFSKRLWHVALFDKHYPTWVVISLYFDPATGRKRIRLTEHFFNKLPLPYNVISIKKVKRADVIFPQEMNSHKSGQPKNKSFCDSMSSGD